MGYTLPRLVGEARAMRLVLLSEAVSAADALAIGLVDEVFPSAQFDQRVHEFARGLAEGPTRAYALSRRLIRHGGASTFEELLELEAATQAEATRTADHANAIAAFLEKRPATFEGR